MLNTYTLPSMFVDKVNWYNCYPSVSTLTFKNISRNLFVLCLSLNLFFLQFTGILTKKFINHTYLVAYYIRNTPSTCSFLIYNGYKRNIYLWCCPLTFKASMVPFFLASKRLNMLGGTLLVVCLLLNTLFPPFFAI